MTDNQRCDKQPTAKPDALEALNELRKKHVVEPEYVPGAGGLLAIIEAALATVEAGPVRCHVASKPCKQHDLLPDTCINHCAADGYECEFGKFQPTESATGGE